MKNKYASKVLIMISLCFATIAIMGDVVIIPIAENIYKTYTDVNFGILNFIISGPGLVSAIVAAFSGKIISQIGSKKFMVIGFGIFTISAVCIGLVENAYYIAVMRMMAGIGMGTVSVVSLVVIAENFIDEKRRSTMMGVYTASMSIMGAVLGALSGMVASLGWKNVFYIYLFTIPILICIIFALPNKKPKMEDETIAQMESKNEKMPWMKVLLLDSSFFIYNSIYCIAYYDVSLIMVEKEITNLKLIGMMTSLATIGSMIACMTFGFYFMKLKRFTPVLGYIIQTVMYIVLYFSESAMICGIACTVLGMSYGLGLSYYMTYATMIVPPVKVPLSSSMITVSLGMSTFLTTYVPYIIEKVIHTDTVVSTIPVLIIILALGTILSIVFSTRESKSCVL